MNQIQKLTQSLRDNIEIGFSGLMILNEIDKESLRLQSQNFPEARSDSEGANPLIGDVSANWQTFNEDDNTYQCTMCDFVLCLITGLPEENEYHYCPQCGTKMKSR